MYYKMFDVYFQKKIRNFKNFVHLFNNCSSFKSLFEFQNVFTFFPKNVHGFKNVFASVNFCAEFSIYFIELFVKT